MVLFQISETPCTHRQFDSLTDGRLLLQLLESQLQLLSSVGVGDVRCDAGRWFLASSQILQRTRDGQVGGAPPILRQAVTDSPSTLPQVRRPKGVIGVPPPVQQVLGRHPRAGDVVGGGGRLVGVRGHGGLRVGVGGAGLAGLK